MLATLQVEDDIQIAQAKAATLAAMNSSTEVERLKKESAAIALKKAAEDAAGGDTIGEALENHLDKKFVSRKTLMSLLKSMSNDKQPKSSKVKHSTAKKTPKGQGQQNARQQQPHQSANRQLHWSPPTWTPPTQRNSHKKRGRDTNSSGAGPSQGGNNRSRGNPYHEPRNNQSRHHQNDKNGRARRY